MLPRSRKHSWAWPLATLALLVTTILSPQSSLLTPHHTFAQGESPPRPDNPYGVNLFLHKEVEPWKIEKTLQMAAEANIPWVKQEFPWQEIEFRKGYFYDDKWQKSSWEKFDNIVNLAERYGLTVIARVDHAPAWAKVEPGTGTGPLKDNRDLADFTIALLDHYKGRIKHVQLWNEPNLAGEWNPGGRVNPAGYAEMLKVVYPAVKESHPDVSILSAPLAMTLEGPESRGNMNELDYWEALYEAGVKGNFDIVSANGYGLDQPPDAAPDPGVLNFRRVELIHDIMERNGDNKQIWFNEFAWNASPETLPPAERNYWRHVTPQQQAQWTVEGVEYARKNWPWAGVLSIWYFRQVGDIPPEKAEYYFAMVHPDFSPQPVYEAVKTAARKYPGPATQGAVPTPASKPSATPAAPAPTRTAPPAPATPTQGATAGSTTTVTGGQATSTPSQATPTPGLAATPTSQVPITITPPSIGPATPTPNTQSDGSGAATILYILGGILVVGGLAALGYYFMRGRGTKVS